MHSFTPLYRQLKDIFLEKITGNEWEDLKIPSEAELCKLYSVSRITVRQALSELENEGYIVKYRGKGSFINVPRIEQDLPSFYSFAEDFKKIGYNPVNKLIEFQLQKASKEIATVLNLDVNDREVYYFNRLRYADKILVAIEFTYLPASVFPGLTKEMLSSKPLYEIMKSNYSVMPISADQYFKATEFDAQDIQYFNFSKHVTAMEIRRIASNGSRIIEYTFGKVRGDMFSYHVKLNK
jgi:GntR family transcriptional regulator